MNLFTLITNSCTSYNLNDYIYIYIYVFTFIYIYQVSLVVSGSSSQSDDRGSNPAPTTGGHLRSRVRSGAFMRCRYSSASGGYALLVPSDRAVICSAKPLRNYLLADFITRYINKLILQYGSMKQSGCVHYWPLLTYQCMSTCTWMYNCFAAAIPYIQTLPSIPGFRLSGSPKFDSYLYLSYTHFDSTTTSTHVYITKKRNRLS